jgi:hypothetical protein
LSTSFSKTFQIGYDWLKSTYVSFLIEETHKPDAFQHRIPFLWDHCHLKEFVRPSPSPEGVSLHQNLQQVTMPSRGSQEHRICNDDSFAAVGNPVWTAQCAPSELLDCRLVCKVLNPNQAVPVI